MHRHLYFGLLVTRILLLITPVSAGTYAVTEGVITHDGQEIQFFGVNWFGAETQDHVPHGLWSQDYQEMIQQIRDLGFNAVRLPFCPSTLKHVFPSG